MRAGQGGVPAQRHLDDWREPAQQVIVRARLDEGGLGEIHLRRHLLHPPGIRRAV